MQMKKPSLCSVLQQNELLSSRVFRKHVRKVRNALPAVHLIHKELNRQHQKFQKKARHGGIL